MSENLIRNASLDVPAQETVDGQPAAQATPLVASDQMIAGPEADAIGKQILSEIAGTAPWMGALLGSIAQDPKGGANIVTQWGGYGDHTPEPDPGKHAAYSAYIRAGVSQAYPWLWPMFEAAGARLAVGPDVFLFFVPYRPLVAFEIPALVPLTKLTPWVESGETIN